MAKLSRVSDNVRRYVEQNYIRSAREQGKRRFSVRVGEVHNSLHLLNRVPLVCSALRRDKFLSDNHLRIVEQSGPPSGMSTTVQITYEFTDEPTKGEEVDPISGLRGILRDVFADLGGGEDFIAKERRAWGMTDTEQL